MQDTRRNELVTADSLEELRRRVPKADQGPTFEVGEVVSVKGYGYRIEDLGPNRIVLSPHGPIKYGRPRSGKARGKRPRR